MRAEVLFKDEYNSTGKYKEYILNDGFLGVAT